MVSDAWRNSFRKSTMKASIELIRTPKKRSGGLIRDADGDLHKSPEPAPPISADMALNKLELTTPSLMSSEPDDYTEKNPDLLARSLSQTYLSARPCYSSWKD